MRCLFISVNTDRRTRLNLGFIKEGVDVNIKVASTVVVTYKVTWLNNLDEQ